MPTVTHRPARKTTAFPDASADARFLGMLEAFMREYHEFRQDEALRADVASDARFARLEKRFAKLAACA